MARVEAFSRTVGTHVQCGENFAKEILDEIAISLRTWI